MAWENLFRPFILFFYLGFAIPLLRVPFEFPREIYLGTTIYLLIATGWRGGEALAMLEASEVNQVIGFMVVGFAVNLCLGFLAYIFLRGRTNPETNRRRGGCRLVWLGLIRNLPDRYRYFGRPANRVC